MANQLDAIMKPKSIAIVGASERPAAIGRELTNKLITYGYKGNLYPVNPKSDTILGVKAYKNIAEIPEVVDLAIIVVPRDFVYQVVEECGQKGVKGLVIITAGYKETGHEGAELEDKLVELIKKYGMRAIGPNCVGIVNTDPSIHLDSTFIEAYPDAGKTAFISQSGALGGAIFNISKDFNVGLSQFVSVGNKADVNDETLLEYWSEDDEIDQILFYLESISNPASFRQLATKVTKKKPIIAVKSGRSSAGAKAASSHTGALAGADMAADALLKQSGIIRVNSILELFEVAQVFTHCPLPKGNKTAIITNAGGPGIMATDALYEYGLEIAELSEKTKEILRANLPPAASVRNPVDMIASANVKDYIATLETVLDDPAVESVMVINLPLVGVDPMEIAKSVMEIRSRRPEKPIIAVFMAKADFFAELNKLHSTVPFFQYPESAARAMSKLYQQRAWVEKPIGNEPEFAVNKAKAVEIFKAALAEKRDQLTTLESIDVLEAYGIRTCKYAFASNVNDAANEANKIGYPVVMKITSTKISHKTEVGGVIVNIGSEEELRNEYVALLSRLQTYGYSENDLDGVIVQEMVKGNREMVCGIATDPQYGHMMMFGLGGIYVETIKDVAFRIAPLTDLDAREMIESVKAHKILKGARGAIPANIPQIEETLLRLSQLVKDFSFIEELDINPLKISDKTTEGIAVDGRIKVKMESAIKALSCGCSCSGSCCG
jgi:acetyltransferase